jgi:hypothetical protein
LQLQEAFAAGLLKPGLNRVYSKEDKKYENDVQTMKQKLAELVAEIGAKAPWIERLDLVSFFMSLAQNERLWMKVSTLPTKDRVTRWF